MVMNLVLAIGIMIIAGFFAGRLAHKLKFPMISGYIVVGILLNPSVLNIISRTSIKDLDIFTSIALGVIAQSSLDVNTQTGKEHYSHRPPANCRCLATVSTSSSSNRSFFLGHTRYDLH